MKEAKMLAEGVIDDETINRIYYSKMKRRCCCTRFICYCWDTRCCTKKRKKRLLPLPRAPVRPFSFFRENPQRYIPSDEPFVSLLDVRNTYGWFPVLKSDLDNAQVPFLGEKECVRRKTSRRGRRRTTTRMKTTSM